MPTTHRKDSTPLREAYRQKFEAQIAELNARLALVRAKASRLAADGRIAAHEEIADTEEKLAALKKKLTALGRASGDAWKDMKTGVEQAGRELGRAAKRAFDRFG